MTRKKRNKDKLGSSSLKKKKKNPFLNRSGGFDLIERFPTYEKNRDKKQKKE